MATRIPVRTSKSRPTTPFYGRLLQHVPTTLIALIILLLLLPSLLNGALRLYHSTIGQVPRLLGLAGPIAPLYSAPVQYWAHDIARWAGEWELDPNLLATVMQIESCGHPTVTSSAGAQGLFQVMPFHFADGEAMLDPDTNAYRGGKYLKECLRLANGDVGLALACYNGGPSVLYKHYTAWPNETQRYYVWGTGIYKDASAQYPQSETLGRWLAAGGAGLCQRASQALGLPQ